MAKAKKSAAVARPNKMIELPAGFKAIEHQGKFFKGEKPGDSLTGKMLKVAVKHFPKKGTYAARDANVYTIETKTGGKVEVTQSGGLGALAEVKKGQQVHIVFLGMKKLKGKQAMREYAVGVK